MRNSISSKPYRTPHGYVKLHSQVNGLTVGIARLLLATGFLLLRPGTYTQPFGYESLNAQ